MRKQFTMQETIEALLSDPKSSLHITPYRCNGFNASAFIEIFIKRGEGVEDYRNLFTVRIDTARKIRNAVEAGKYPTLKVTRQYGDHIVKQSV